MFKDNFVLPVAARRTAILFNGGVAVCGRDRVGSKPPTAAARFIVLRKQMFRQERPLRITTFSLG